MAAKDRTVPLSTLLDRLSLAEVERAICDLRHGLPVVLLDGAAPPALVAAAELAVDGLVDLMRQLAHAEPLALVSHPRAETLKIRLYTPDAVALRLSGGLDRPDRLRALADPSLDMGHPLQGPFEAERTLPPMPHSEALQLLKLAELLPVAVAAPLAAPKPAQWAQARRLSAVQAEAVRQFADRAAEALELLTSARLPLKVHENATILAFRPLGGGADHFAVVVGKPDPGAAPLTRIHSQCFTGDLLGSLKCDCGEQLHGALERMGENGGGVLIYLSQEGRGIGLVNKVRAYRLQDQGFDTVQANQRLGFGIDERAYKPAAEILKRLGFPKIRLMTNNPAKLAAMERFGIHVAERVPLTVSANRHNEDYLRTKADKTGHDL